MINVARKLSRALKKTYFEYVHGEFCRLWILVLPASVACINTHNVITVYHMKLKTQTYSTKHIMITADSGF